jgi:hypothetical protein
MKRIIILFFVFAIIGLITSGIACVRTTSRKPEPGTDAEKAFEEAKKIFVEQKAAGVDMSKGPCLSNEVIPDWVADVAHWPRQSIDNDPQNQCPAYREGKAHHFIELDPEGNFIRAY